MTSTQPEHFGEGASVQPERSAKRGVEGSDVREILIERFSSLGEGVGTLDGRAVFVPNAFPGERVRARVETSGKVLRGEGTERLTTSPDRRPSACPVSDACGGCDWIELDAAAQTAAKLEMVRSTLEHLGGISRADLEIRPVLGGEASLGLRRRAALRPGPDGLGFSARKSHEHVAIERCPALVPALEALPGRLSVLLGKEGRKLLSIDLLAATDEDGVMKTAAAFHLRGRIATRHRTLASRAREALGLSGVVLVPEQGAPEQLGRPVLSSPAPCAPAAKLHVRPDAFCQADEAANQHLVEAVTSLAGPTEAHRVLELYAGNGNFSLALGTRARSVLAVESSGVSIGLGQRSVREAGLTGVRFVLGDVTKVCDGLIRESQTFDLLVADPPRTGAKGLGQWAAALQVSRVVYVACDAHALARDAAGLVDAGYRPLVLQLVDQFPRTHHVEAVLSFERAA